MPFKIKKPVKNIILTSLVVQLIAGFATMQIAIVACCGNAEINQEVSDGDFRANYIPKYSEEDIDWANKVAKSARNMGWQDLKEKFAAQELIDNSKRRDIGDISDMQDRRPTGLYVFVSFSMSKPLLQNYLKEAVKYEAVLVFKGLPNGSFIEFNKKIMDLIGQDQDLADRAAMQIDDEAFDIYSITRVPAIVLTKDNRDSWILDDSHKLVYDRITGNIGIKYALEQFKNSGDLEDIASDYLINSKDTSNNSQNVYLSR